MNTQTFDTAAEIEQATETLRRLDRFALGVIHDRALIALEVQEGTKAELLRVLQPNGAAAQNQEDATGRAGN